MVRTGPALLLRQASLFLLLVLLNSNCIKQEDEEIIFCPDSAFPYFCPSAGKCCSLPFYGKQLNKCYASLSDCASSGQSCETCAIETGNDAGNYFYANWSCGSSSQCATVMGAPSGTAGPFCDQSACDAWGKKFIPAGYTCSTSPAQTASSGTPPNGKCFQVGDF